MKLTDANEVWRQVAALHEDAVDGDLNARVFAYASYRLVDLNLDGVDSAEWAVADERLSDLAALPLPAPPIVFDPARASIIDGAHRVTLAVRRGERTIAAYVGEGEPDYSYEIDDSPAGAGYVV